MTNIRELLDEATRDVVTDPSDATDRVRRRLRVRRQHTAAVVVVVAVVIAAIVVPLSLIGGSSNSVTPGNHHPRHVPVLQRWTNEDGAVAAGFGAIWALHTCDTTRCQTWVDELDRGTGKRLARVLVTGPARKVAAGGGVVWVIGTNPATGGGTLTVIDPTTRRAFPVRLSATDGPLDITFAYHSAWITFPQRHQVRRYGPIQPGNRDDLSTLPTSVIRVSGLPTEIGTTGDGHVWVRVGANKLSEVGPVNRQSVSTGSQVVKTVSWGSPIFSAVSPPNILLALGAGATVGTLEPSLLNSCHACAQGGGFFAKGTVNDVLQTDRGWWVATSQRTYFYDQKSFRSGGHPTASLSGQASSLAPDGRGVIVGNRIIGLFRWTPPGP